MRTIQQEMTERNAEWNSNVSTDHYLLTPSGSTSKPLGGKDSKLTRSGGGHGTCVDDSRTRQSCNKHSRIKGPMEEKYMSVYHRLVQDRRTQFHLRYPGVLVNYRMLDEPEKEREQRRVMELLQRLQIHTTQSEHEDSLLLYDDVSHHSECGSPLVPNNHNRATLSTERECRKLHHCDGKTPSKSMVDDRIENPSAISDASIEIPRAASMPFDSPALEVQQEQQRKRAATTSGKRGADLIRPRTENFHPLEDKCMLNTPSKLLEVPLSRLSIGEDNEVFTSSQSPISHRASYIAIDSPMGNQSQTSISLGGEEESCDTVPRRESLEETAIMERTTQWNLDQRVLRDVPQNYGAQTNTVPDYKPLDIRYRTNQHLTQSCPCPLEGYGKNDRLKLEYITEWIRCRDVSNSNITRSGLVLSLTRQKVMDVTLKLLVESTTSYDRSTDEFGRTLIVARSKDDLDEWSRAFRERTSFKVLNHAILPLRERKTETTSTKCAQYDIILTTFDAMKAPDSNIAIDDNGVTSVRTKLEVEDGWYTIRRNAPKKDVTCRQLSVLHQLHWRRVIFTDVPGKKCFVAKRNTTRATAARAFLTDSR